MVRYRIAVCDDEPSELGDIVQCVKRYDVHGDFDIENYADGAVLLSDLQLKRKFFDLLLLDIEMPSNGFQLAQTLTQMEKHPLVIFVTKRHEYAVQGYGIAFRYLVKPLDESLFTAAMDAVVQELDSKHFTVEYEGATLSLETSDIYYLESHGHKVLIHCKGQDLTLRIIRMSDVELTPVEWLWKPYLPFGKLSVLQGNPGEGKTYFAMHLAAACTNGKLLPNMERMEPFNVIYQTAEDGLGDTVKPRLIEAGADLDRVLVIDDSDVQLTLSDERIEKAIIENNARLVIIDPIQAYLGADVDMNRANEVRPIFMRLGQVAQRTGCAILLIGHLNKAAGMQSLQRGLGSIDIAAAVRSVMFIGKLKHDPTMRILTHEKSSLAPPGVSLAFSLGDEGGFRWVGEYDITADEMLSGIEPQRETKTQQAKDLICALLAGGKQVLSEDIDKAALERGIPGRTVRDAKRELGDALKSKIVEGRKKVFWME